MFMKRCELCLMALISLVPAVAACAQGGSAEDTVRLMVDADGRQHVQVRGGSYFFEPDHIIVKVNVPVELSLSREWGIVPHTFVLKIPESGIMIDETLSTDPKTVIFTPTVVGKFKFYCKNKFLFFKSHEEKGMKGILEVVP
jgi:plastocyanin